ncbi:hypothetical protein R3P38DRAFT_3494020 [Favolaschia claudopus]|uniref:Uncharacterized protein n=2 Tax=Favolaschia claudopus TaxID=2862362 RepID=A0AAW0C9A3_9AGAR
MKMLLDTIQLLRGDMHEVKQRLGALETSISELQRFPSTADDVSADASTDREPDTTTDEDDGVTLGAVDVTVKENRVLQTYMTQTTRRLCNVMGRRWPDPEAPRMNTTTGEIYLTPNFAAGVKEARNALFVRRVAERAFADLADSTHWPVGLDEERSPSFDLAFLLALAKKSFNSLKKGWKQMAAIEASISADANRRNHRPMMRRKRVSSHFSNAFAAAHGLDPAMFIDVIHEQFLSDELSGPDSDASETQEEWKERLAGAAGLPTAPESLAKFQFFEVVVPDWHASWCSDLIHDMEAFAGLTKNLKYHRVEAGRAFDRIPRFAPFNFAIAPEWLAANGKLPANKKLLKEWMEWPEPEDCGLIFERDEGGQIIQMSYEGSPDAE